MSFNALQKAIVARLAATPALVAIIGPDRVFDQRITRLEPPYLVLGEARTNDYSTGDGPGSEHRFEIEAWSKNNGRKQAVALADAVLSALHQADLGLEGAVLVNLRHERTTISREPKSRLHVARIRFRAVTEP